MRYPPGPILFIADRYPRERAANDVHSKLRNIIEIHGLRLGQWWRDPLEEAWLSYCSHSRFRQVSARRPRAPMQLRKESALGNEVGKRARDAIASMLAIMSDAQVHDQSFAGAS